MRELQIKMLRADRPAGIEPAEQERDADFTDTGRLVALCDGVFAIIITLLVLEIHRPSAEPGSLAQELLSRASYCPTQPTPWKDLTQARIAIPNVVM